jgi:HAD superfamily hydrolase (TIGR01509 family)
VSNIDFANMRSRTGIPAGDLFTVMEEWRDASRVRAAMDVILELEADAQRTLALQPGLEALLAACVADGLQLAIVTRNTPDAVDALFSRLGAEWRPRFTQVLTRHFPYVKPDRRLLLHVAQQWGVQPSELLMVGDSREDVEIGAICGAATCLIAGGGNELVAASFTGGITPTFTVGSLGELAAALREGGTRLAPAPGLPQGVGFLAALLDAGVLAPAATSYPRLGDTQRGFAPCGSGSAQIVLHVDCGDGGFTKTLHSHGLDARGLDGDAAAADAARARGLAAAALPALAPGSLGAGAEAAHDCVLCVAHGPEKVNAPSLLLDGEGALRPGALEEAWRVLRPGGALAIEWRSSGGAAPSGKVRKALAAAAQRGFTARPVGDAGMVAIK